ncbi:hypothetical protein NAC44_06315 [Allorhizobium sp. BGMRC 0089]|nr:hypothetical protein [Allorhizobium sonneratiae]
MTADNIVIIRKLRSAAISVWENEGGAPGPSTDENQFGRRIELDRSWTVYHVYSGAPAIIDGQHLTGLNKASATHGMLSLNLHNIAHQEGRLLRPSDPERDPPKEL